MLYKDHGPLQTSTEASPTWAPPEASEARKIQENPIGSWRNL